MIDHACNSRTEELNGVPASIMAGRKTNHMRQEGNSVQHDLGSWYRFKLLESDTGQFILDIFNYSNSNPNPTCTIKLKV